MTRPDATMQTNKSSRLLCILASSLVCLELVWMINSNCVALNSTWMTLFVTISGKVLVRAGEVSQTATQNTPFFPSLHFNFTFTHLIYTPFVGVGIGMIWNPCKHADQEKLRAFHFSFLFSWPCLLAALITSDSSHLERRLYLHHCLKSEAYRRIISTAHP